MDELSFAALVAEMRDDVQIVERAGSLVEERFAETSAANLEGCAFHLVRRVTIAVPGVRPALFPESARPALQDLRGFRHVITHAYDLELDRQRMELVVRSASVVVKGIGAWVELFATTAAQMHAWTLEPTS